MYPNKIKICVINKIIFLPIHMSHKFGNLVKFYNHEELCAKQAEEKKKDTKNISVAKVISLLT